MDSTVYARKDKEELHVSMDIAVEALRKEIWKAIFRKRGNLSDCDVAMALGLVQYELVHHVGEE